MIRKYSEGGGSGYRLRLKNGKTSIDGFNGHRWDIFNHKFNSIGKEIPSWDVYVSGYHVLTTENFNDIDKIIEVWGGKSILDDSNAEYTNT
jgi:hypothetical protein